MPNPTKKEGQISQRVPEHTVKQLERLSKKAKLPKAVVLQLLIDADYKKVFKK